jgi:hypothetical protein
MTDPISVTLEHKVESLIAWRDGYDLSAMHRTLTQLDRAVNGDRDIRAEGLMEKTDRLIKMVEAMEQNERDRKKQIEGLLFATKIISIATTAVAAQPLLQLLGFLFGGGISP